MNFGQDAKYVLGAFIMLAGIVSPAIPTLSWVIYITFGYLLFNAGLIIITSGTLLNTDLFQPQSVTQHIYRNKTLHFLLNVLTAIFLYTIYSQGYVFLSGFLTFMLTITFTSNILSSLAEK